MSPSSVKRPTLRRRPVKRTIVQAEPGLKAAEVAAKSKCSASYAQLQTNTPTPKIADKAMAERIAASYAAQPASKRFIFKGEVLERVGGVSGVCLWRWMRDGNSESLARSAGAWLGRSEIDEWMSSRPLRQYKSRGTA